jgi:hypothetical protein
VQQRAKQKLEEQLALMHEAFSALQQPSVPLDRMAQGVAPMALDADDADESEEEGGADFDSPLGAGNALNALLKSRSACLPVIVCPPKSLIYMPHIASWQRSHATAWYIDVLCGCLHCLYCLSCYTVQRLINTTALRNCSSAPEISFDTPARHCSSSIPALRKPRFSTVIEKREPWWVIRALAGH